MAVPQPSGVGGRENGENDEWTGNFGDDAVEVPEDLQAVLSAAEAGNTESLSRALGRLTVAVDSYGEDRDTALHLACLYGHMPCAQLLLAAGASVDVRDEDGALPLHDAAAGGFDGIVQMLLRATKSQEELKRVLQATDTDGDTPLHHAARGDHADVVRQLLNHGALPNLKNNSYQTPADLTEDDEVRQILLVAEDKINPGSVDDKLMILKRRKI